MYYQEASKGEHEKAEGTSAAGEPPCEGTAATRKVKTATRRRSTFVGDNSKATTDDKRGDADKRLSKMPTLFGGDTAATVTSSSRVEPPSTKKPWGCFSAVVCGAKRPATTAFQGTLSPPTGSSSSLLAPRCSQDGAPPSAEDMVIEDVEMEDLSDAIGESLSQQAPLADFKGTYVVSDTNIFLSNLDLLKKIVLPDTGNEDMVLCVPWMAIQELDNIKTKKKGPLSSSAVAAIKFVYQALSSKNPRLRGQTVAEALQKDDNLPKGCQLNDDHFVHWCLKFKKQGSKVLLVSNDRNLRNKAMINSIDTLSADELEEKLFLPGARNDRQWLPKSSTKRQKHSPLLLQASEHGFCARQEQNDAAKETSNTPVVARWHKYQEHDAQCIVPPHDGDAVSKEVREILCTSLDLVLKSELERAFGSVWLRVVDFKPPWTEETALQCILRHWIALTGTAFKPSLKLVICFLLAKLSSKFGPSEIAPLATQLCSELQLHYPQLAGGVARLKELSEQALLVAAPAQPPDGRTSLLPSVTCSHPRNTTSSLTMPSYRKPPVNAVSRTGGEEQKDGASKEPQRSGISGPFHAVPGCLTLGEWRPLRQPKEDVPLNPLRQPKEDVPLNRPPVLETTTPLMLFQDSWAVLNDYCGNLCTKVPAGHLHEFPFNMRAVCNTNGVFIRNTYGIVVRVLDYVTAVVRMFGSSRDNMVDLAEALIVALTKILETLRHEGIPKEKTWRVEVDDMADFLVDPNNRGLLTVAKRQIGGLHDSLALCLLHIISPTKPARR